MQHWLRRSLLLVCTLAALGTAPRCVADEARPLRVCILSGCNTYHSELSLPPFRQFLEKTYNVTCSLIERKGDELPGLEQLDDCDVAFIFIKRMKLQGEQLAKFKAYATSGKPIVAVRTASHAVQTWLEFDHEVLGGNYHSHYPVGPVTQIDVVAGAEQHPILAGVQLTRSADALYKNEGHASDIEVLLRGTIPGQPSEAIAWTRAYKGGRVFYTSLGSQETFQNENFRRLLANALFWSVGRKVELKGSSSNE